MEPVTAPRRGRPPRNPDVSEAMSVVEGLGVTRPEPRPEMRQEMRDEDPLERAARRTAQLLGHVEELGDGPDEFYINPNDVPTGWAYEWKRHITGGQEDPSYQVELAKGGWEPVPTSRHPTFMPPGSTNPIIERKGMILMERPAEISSMVRNMLDSKARKQVRDKEAQLNAAQAGHFERQKSDGDSLVRLGKSYEPISVPN